MARKEDLKTSILNLLNEMFDRTENSTQAREDFAELLTNAMDTYDKAGKITIPAGAIVVTGSATTQSNPAPIVLNNTIS